MFRQVHLLIPTLTAVLIFLPIATLRATTATTSPAAPTTNPGGAGAAGRAAAGAQPVVKCAWGDLLRVAVHGGKLDVAIKPPPAIAADLMNRKSVDVDIEDAADKSWRLQGVPRRQPGGVIGGRAAPAAPGRAGGIDFVGRPRVRGRGVEPTTRVSDLMILQGTFRLGGRSTRNANYVEIEFRSYADKTNVMLRIRDMVRGRRMGVQPFEAGDLQQLRREHPAEVRLYLEPLLMEICGGRNPLRPQPGDVYRAFDFLPPESPAIESVKKLVEAFDSLEPATREAASAQLNQLGRAGVHAATHVDRTDLSAEQALRLDAFIARHSTLTDIAAARRDPLFLVDCLEDDDRAVRAAALTALRELTDRPVDFDIDAPAAQRREAAAALLGEFLPPQPATTVAP